MSKPTHREPLQTAPSTTKDDQIMGFTRRKVLAGAAATTAVTTIGVDTPAIARSVDANSKPDMDAFVALSAVLTGIVAGSFRRPPIPSMSNANISTGSTKGIRRGSKPCCRSQARTPTTRPR